MEHAKLVNLTADRPDAYEAFPRLLTAPDGRVWVVWCSLRDRRDEICLRSFRPSQGPEGCPALSPVEVVSEGNAVNFWPTHLLRDDGTLTVVWATHTGACWEVVLRERALEGAWRDDAQPIARHAWQPAATVDSAGLLWVAWADVPNSTICVTHDDGPVEVVSGPDSQRPALLANEAGVTVAWDSYAAGTYDVYARRWSAEQHTWGPIQRVSRAPDSETIPNLGPGPDGSVLCCWVSDADVRDERGIIDLRPTIRCALLDGDAWQPAGEDAFGTVVDICHGLLAKEAIWGYLGRRRHPFIRLDADGIPWLLWERKQDADASVREGHLLARPYRDGKWGPASEIAAGHVFYVVEDRQPSQDNRLWCAMREAFGKPAWDILLGQVKLKDSDETPDTSTDAWSGWQRISLPRDVAPSPVRPRIVVDEQDYRLFFGDVHAHTALSADAEGEMDELLRYARDKAGLDFVALIDNDCYQCPLMATEYEVSRELNERSNQPGRFVTLPGYEWTLWNQPRVPHPYHRSVLFPGESELIRHVDPGKPTTEEMARRVAELGGLLFTQHWDWTLTDSPAEAGLEVCSAWQYYIDKPEPFFRDLTAGRRLAFVGGSDSHRRNPGLCGALTAVYATELTREAIFEALRQRCCYATTGSKIVLDVRVNGAPMGSEITSADAPTVGVLARGTRPLRRVAIWRGECGAGGTVREVFAQRVSAPEATLWWTDPEPVLGTAFYHVAVEQDGQDGQDTPYPSNLVTAEGCRAWSSPVWVSAG